MHNCNRLSTWWLWLKSPGKNNSLVHPTVTWISKWWSWTHYRKVKKNTPQWHGFQNDEVGHITEKLEKRPTVTWISKWWSWTHCRKVEKIQHSLELAVDLLCRDVSTTISLTIGGLKATSTSVSWTSGVACSTLVSLCCGAVHLAVSVGPGFAPLMPYSLV